MAKDDYDVIVYKILLYYYAILKRKISYKRETFEALIAKADISNEYLTDILRMMQGEGQIDGVRFTKAWGGNCILISDLSEISITPAGIRYLNENTIMKRIGKTISEIPGIAASLIGIVQPFM